MIQSHAYYQGRIAEGYKYQAALAARWRELGHVVDLPPLRIAPSHGETSEYMDAYDLRVYGHHVEVKSKAMSFGPDASKFPFETVVILPVRSWDRLATKPSAIAIVSQATGSAVIVPCSTAPIWTVETMSNRLVGKSYPCFVVDRKYLRTEGEFLAWAKEHRRG